VKGFVEKKLKKKLSEQETHLFDMRLTFGVALLAPLCLALPPYFGFWGPDAAAQMSPFSNLAFANNPAEAIANSKYGIHSLMKLHGVFVNTTTKWHYHLYPDYEARWAAVVPSYKSLLANNSLLGFFLGDELLWNGMTFVELKTYARAVRTAFPTNTGAIIYTNAAWPTFFPTMPGQKQTFGTLGAVPDANLWSSVPDELDWFGVDVYPDQFSMMGAKNMVRTLFAPFYRISIGPLAALILPTLAALILPSALAAPILPTLAALILPSALAALILPPALLFSCTLGSFRK
jgi:hypothetical protein